jgi:rhodanese-related sulfurtransferase
MEHFTISAQKLYDNMQDYVIIDVREPSEYNSEHIVGAVNIPISTLNAEQFTPYQDKQIVIHCGGGRRAKKACEFIRQNTHVITPIILIDGFRGWKSAGLPIKTNGKKIIPLERQLQIAIGILIFTFSLLGYGVSTTFFTINMFVGLGLVFAGLSGFCGLALIIAKMPWNRQKN